MTTTQANNSSNPAVAATMPSAPPKLVPVDSIVQTAGIVTSFARRDLDQLAKFEPEGAEYVMTRHTLLPSHALEWLLLLLLDGLRLSLSFEFRHRCVRACVLARYLQRLRNLLDSLASIPTPVGSRTDMELQQIASSINLVTAFSVREDVVDDMDDEGLRELSQSMQLLRQVRTVAHLRAARACMLSS